jgi:hypothetical protein
MHRQIQSDGCSSTKAGDVTFQANPNLANMPIDLSRFPTPELFALYRLTLAELRARGIVRTDNAPTGDYAEYLVATAFDGELAPNSEKGWDIKLATEKRIQVKARVVSDPPRHSQLQLSPFRSFDFDVAIIVLLADGDYSVRQAVELPRELVEAKAKYNEHVNAHILFATADVLNHELAVDVTAALTRLAAQEEPPLQGLTQ